MNNTLSKWGIEQAGHQDGESILTLLKERASYLKSKGSEQWSFLLTGNEDDELLELITKGLFYKMTIKDDHDLVATFMLSSVQEDWDVHLWGESIEVDTVYLHKLAVALKYKGNGIGDILLNWIIQHAIELGNRRIRLDCVAGSMKLRRLYEENGFKLIEVVHDHCLYELELR
ncbi:GNAT family N-acetyltransferase [Sutcliffiella rhizosphaerae]|uniref:N-acetyltransferase domain-containing protein n=1 Tax=Sutcliffiella rhizosphaerae TaxID=2880967 RepID=A0ABN8A4R2_9BACI|nr:GNAT family N-acetyltransferase [Sutcliffiella rhizosphaerae]CAG9620105.1 hypothetical protein BACCIP111883_00873 [Sutcliffiella rhizosphaerae]